MLYVVNSSHYMNWEQGKDDDGEVDVIVHNDESTYLMVGVFSSLKSAAKAIAKFSREFRSDEDEMEGPLEGFNVSVAELDGSIEDGYHLTSVGVFEEEIEVYKLLEKASIERLRRIEAAAIAKAREAREERRKVEAGAGTKPRRRRRK